MNTLKGERIAKVIARAGICSRREAERYIEQGRIAVNGQVLTSPAFTVAPSDRITVDQKPLPVKERTRVWRYYKPAGLITSHKDPQGRPTVFDALPDTLPRVISIGRLDLNSEGLLLLTNDGELARRIELPSTGWVRRYRVRIHGDMTPEMIAKLAQGIVAEGIRYAGVQAVVDKKQGTNTWLTVSLKEGKNREIRRLMEALGVQVTRLIRISYGPFQLGALPKGGIDEINAKILNEQLGGLGVFIPPPRNKQRLKKA
ncbi:MAG: rRNA pseudouridine synthase [Alphaproteobacteria bacterium]|nr:rRNA pseudouridine synthase [Alphaproteobacteria bacterium]